MDVKLARGAGAWIVEQEAGPGVWACWFVIRDVPPLTSEEAVIETVRRAGLTDLGRGLGPLEVGRILADPAGSLAAFPSISWADLVAGRVERLKSELAIGR